MDDRPAPRPPVGAPRSRFCLFRCWSLGCGEAKQRWGDGRQEGGNEGEGREGGAGRAGKGGGDCRRAQSREVTAATRLVRPRRLGTKRSTLCRGGLAGEGATNTVPHSAALGPLRKRGRGPQRGSAPS